MWLHCGVSGTRRRQLATVTLGSTATSETEQLVSLGLVGPGIALFALTNIDDIVVLAVFFGRATSRSGRLRVVLGQYVGFVGILLAAVVGTLGAGLLPEQAIPYLGFLPLALGLRAAWKVWRERREAELDGEAGSETRDAEAQGTPHPGEQPGVLTVAAVTLANGGDNIGVYVPVFAGHRYRRLDHVRDRLSAPGCRVVPRRLVVRNSPRRGLPEAANELRPSRA